MGRGREWRIKLREERGKDEGGIEVEEKVDMEGKGRRG